MCEKPLAMNSRGVGRAGGLGRKQPGWPPASATTSASTRCTCEARERGPPRRRWARSITVNGSYVQDWLLLRHRLQLARAGRARAARCGRWPTSARTGWTWSTSITGLEVESVCADLNDRPPGPPAAQGRGRDLQRASWQAGRHRAGRRSRPRTTAASCSASAAAPGAACGSRRSPPGRKNCLRYEIAGSKCALAWNSETPNELWIGHRERAERAADPRPVAPGPAGRAGYINYPGGHNEGFPTPSSSASGRSTATSRGRLLGARRRSRPSPTATARSCSARRS